MPKEFRCALVAQLANVSGSGKLAIYNSLEKFLDEFLVMPPVPPSNPGESLDDYHHRVMGLWKQEAEREQQLIRSFASILNAEPPMAAPPVQRSAQLLMGHGVSRLKSAPAGQEAWMRKADQCHGLR